MARPRVRNPRRASLVGSLLERDGQQSLVTARWRHSTHRPAAGVRGSQQRTPLNLPTHDAAPLSTLDRHGSAFRYANAVVQLIWSCGPSRRWCVGCCLVSAVCRVQDQTACRLVYLPGSKGASIVFPARRGPSGVSGRVGKRGGVGRGNVGRWKEL